MSTNNAGRSGLLVNATDHFRQRFNLFLNAVIVVVVGRFLEADAIDNGFTRISAAHEFSQLRIVSLHRVPNDRTALRIDRIVVQHGLCSSNESTHDPVRS